MKFLMLCRGCRILGWITGKIGEKPLRNCPYCAAPMTHYFGEVEGLPNVNYGYRESSYSNQTDADIAKFQFTNL